MSKKSRLIYDCYDYKIWTKAFNGKEIFAIFTNQNVSHSYLFQLFRFPYFKKSIQM